MSQAILNELMRALDEDHAHAVIEHRRVTIKKPLTVHAAKLLAKRLSEWGDANEAADLMIERCWQGFDASWVRDRRRRNNGRRNHIDAALDAMRDENGPASIFGNIGHA
jgi:hypothetical protein